MYLFGSGVMTVTPAGANQTPINIGLLQEMSIEGSRTLKELCGQYADPLAVGAGTRKWSGKAKVARISGRVLNAIYFGGSLATGQTTTAIAEAQMAVASVKVANAATCTQDQGVVYAPGCP
jgi:hypothetical protein